MDDVLRLVQRRTGLAFPPNRRFAAVRAVPRLMERVGACDASQLLRRLEAEPELFAELVSALTVNESYFFREPEQLRFVQEEVFPGMLAGATAGQPARLWSAGCAGGEEPYSLAILLHKAGGLPRAEVLGTDVDEVALARARRGSYSTWSLRGVGHEDVRRYFRRRGNDFELDTEIRAQVHFRTLNLAEPAPLGGMDLILCRNVLIYFERDTVEQVIRSLFGALREGGWLLLGGADPLISDIVPCEVVHTGSGLAYRKRERRRAVRGGPAVPAVAGPPRPEPRAAAPVPSTGRTPQARPESPAHESPRTPPQSPAPATEAVCVAAVRGLLAEGRRSEAQASCAAGLELHPLAAELFYLNAVLLSESGHDAEAANSARQALYLDRHLAVAHLAFGQSLLRLGEQRRALHAFRAAEAELLALEPGMPVPAAGGVNAQSLLALVRQQLHLLRPTAG